MNKKLSIAMLLAASSVFAAPAFAAAGDRLPASCASLPTFTQLQAALATAVGTLGSGTTNQGFGLPMWATLVDNSGRVCAVAKVGGTDPWLGSRAISAQKANTANAFSTDNISLSTANLYSAVQPGGSLYGLQHSNPVNTIVAYRGSDANFGTANDPMVGLRVGGVNVFGGGLALYNSAKHVIGAVGVSGDSSCADHNIAWKLRTGLSAISGSNVANLVPGGVSPGQTGAGSDNIQYPANTSTAATGWQQPMCSSGVTAPSLGSLGN